MVAPNTPWEQQLHGYLQGLGGPGFVNTTPPRSYPWRAADPVAQSAAGAGQGAAATGGAAPAAGGAATATGGATGTGLAGAGGLLGGTMPASTGYLPGSYTGTNGLMNNTRLNDPYAANSPTAQPNWYNFLNDPGNRGESTTPNQYELQAFQTLYGMDPSTLQWSRDPNNPRGWVASGQNGQSYNFSLYAPPNTGTGAYNDSWWVDSNWNNGLGRDLQLGQAGMMQFPASFDVDRPAGHQYYNGPYIANNSFEVR
jgi:hypothetical protein